MIVTCSLPTGLRLTVGEREIVLLPGVNDVDDAFWAEWFAEHETFSPVVDGSIVAVHPSAGPVADPDPAPAPALEPKAEA